MTPKEIASGWMVRHGLQLVIYVVAVSVAWATLTAAVQQKADKTEVTELARDIRAIKTLICKDHPGDSLCR